MKKIFLTAMLFFLSGKIILSQPYGWQYMTPVQVTENSGNALYNYQLALTINTQALISAGRMDANGNDIRFKSGCMGANLNYWIDSGINTASTVIWVQIDTLLASSSKTIFMLYGNPSAPAASTLAVFNGPYSATDSVNITNAGGVGDSQRGFRFAPTEDILVASFGKNEPNGTTRFVTLFDFTTQAIVRQRQVSGPMGIYSYSPLSSPVWLTQNTQYVLELFQGASDGYYYQTSSQIGQQLVYYDMRYCNGCTESTFPTNVLSNYHYGLPDFWYYTKSNVTPAPTYTSGSGYHLLFAGSDTSLCQGAQVQIGNPTASGYPPFSYSWNPSTSLSSDSIAAPTASPLTTTTYIVTATDSFGCAASDTVTLTVFPLPAVSFSISPDTICLSANSLTLSGGSPSGGTYSGPGVSAGMFNPNTAGLGAHAINYSFTDSIGCTNTSVDTIVVDVCTGVQDLDAGNYFEVYPNPAKGELRIQSRVFGTELRIEKIEFYNMVGEKISSYKPTISRQQQIVIDISELKPGIYFLKIQTPDESAAKKFVKE